MALKRFEGRLAAWLGGGYNLLSVEKEKDRLGWLDKKNVWDAQLMKETTSIYNERQRLATVVESMRHGSSGRGWKLMTTISEKQNRQR
ncbi:hypothetical protein Csa_014453 [Cucumis sativus]|uniref:Uncharacterized protein n=1 Tax=Cucumis sativus TaxID=3659 RepID=A0A0A0KVY6_CUCSA|nr:hypothetical protein Csa_014453 [Cucumis sativus]